MEFLWNCERITKNFYRVTERDLRDWPSFNLLQQNKVHDAQGKRAQVGSFKVWIEDKANSDGRYLLLTLFKNSNRSWIFIPYGKSRTGRKALTKAILDNGFGQRNFHTLQNHKLDRSLVTNARSYRDVASPEQTIGNSCFQKQNMLVIEKALFSILSDLILKPNFNGQNVDLIKFVLL